MRIVDKDIVSLVCLVSLGDGVVVVVGFDGVVDGVVSDGIVENRNRQELRKLRDLESRLGGGATIFLFRFI